MYLLAKEYDSFDTLPIDARVRILRRELDALTQANLEYLQLHPETPALYEWAPRYKIKPRPFVPAIREQADIWQDIPSTMRRGTCDCKDCASWRAAELYNARLGPVGFHIKVQQVGDLVVYHIQVEGFDRNGIFRREDPSKILGMPTIVTPAQLSALMNG